MPELNALRSGRPLTLLCVLFSAHFSLAYNTLTKAMVPFHGYYNELKGVGGPFAYRMLPALLWKLSVFTLAPLHARFPALHLPDLNKPLSSNEEWFMTLLTFLAMFGTLQVSRALLRAIDGRVGFEWMALGMGYVAYFDTILVLNRNFFYPYDVLGLFFFTLLVYLAFRDRPVAFTLALVPAMLNKETAIMAVLVYFGLWVGRKPMKTLVAVCCGMGAVGIAVRLAQAAYIRHLCPWCPEMAENQLRDNLHQLPNPLFWLSEFAVFGFAYVAAIIFWRYVPRQVRRTALPVYLLWLAGMTVVGILREVRIFSELSALLLLVVGTGVHGWLGRGRAAEAPGAQHLVSP